MFRNLTIASSSSLREVMEFLVSSGQRIAFLVEGERLIAVLSDGDIRKAILSGASLDSMARSYANTRFKFVREDADPVEIHKAFGGEGITHLPVVDSEFQLISILTAEDNATLPISEPNLSIVERNYLIEAFDSGWISSQGRFVEEFENRFKHYVGSSHAVAVSNGTIALVLALKILGISSEDEVIVPNVTFGATANAVVQVGAKPRFVDVDTNSGNLDLGCVENSITEKTKAIIPVHLYGYPAKMPEIMLLAKKYNLYVIEDAAEALGSRINGRHVGTFGDFGTFSFFANKTITTGEGGMLVFNREEFLSKARMMRSHGMSPSRKYWHETWGSNFRLTNLQSAIGVAQMSRIEELVKAKIDIAFEYNRILSTNTDLVGVLLPHEIDLVHSHWLTSIQSKGEISIDNLSSYLRSEGVETRKAFSPLNKQPAFSAYCNEATNFPNSELFSGRTLCLPSSTNVSLDQIERVCRLILKFIGRS